MNTPPVYIAVSTSLGTMDRVEFATCGRFPGPPRGKGWHYDSHAEVWYRAASDENIADELAHLERYYSGLTLRDGTPHPDRRSFTGWKRLTDAERLLVEQDRPYRRALVLRNGALEHDIDAARECHRNHLRRMRAHALPQLDAQWMRATGQGQKEEGARVERKRQQWRDAPSDPRIASAPDLGALKQLLQDLPA
jgi:hypothetical protein